MRATSRPGRGWAAAARALPVRATFLARGDRGAQGLDTRLRECGTGPPAAVTSRETPDGGSSQGRGDVKILFLAPGDVLKGRVEPIMWMRMCEAYAQAGLRVSLVTLRIRRPDSIQPQEIWRHFGIKGFPFRIISVPVPLDRSASTRQFRVWAGLVGLSFAALTGFRAATGRERVQVVHSRSPVLLSSFLLLKRVLPRRRQPLMVLETHSLPTKANSWIVRAADLVVVNSEKLAADVQATFGLASARVLHAPLPPHNAVSPRPRSIARDLLDLDADAKIACYTGKLTREHCEFLLATAGYLRQRDRAFRLLLVGGNPEIIAWSRRRAQETGVLDTVILAGFVAPADVDVYQSAADVLVYHAPAGTAVFDYTTPAKGYEYQVMERPIVATDFPLFGEVFGQHGERAICVTDRSPRGLADAIVAAFALEDGGRMMTERAAAFVAGRTWEARTTAILDTLGIR